LEPDLGPATAVFGELSRLGEVSQGRVLPGKLLGTAQLQQQRHPFRRRWRLGERPPQQRRRGCGAPLPTASAAASRRRAATQASAAGWTATRWAPTLPRGAPSPCRRRAAARWAASRSPPAREASTESRTTGCKKPGGESAPRIS